MNRFYGSLNSAMDNLNESLTDTNKYREESPNRQGNLASEPHLWQHTECDEHGRRKYRQLVPRIVIHKAKGVKNVYS